LIDRFKEASPIVFDYWLAGIVTAGLLVYLTPGSGSIGSRDHVSTSSSEPDRAAWM
jgi:hypothetical protein